MIPDVLAARYASPELVRLWSPEHKVVLERELWLAVLRAQADLGVPVEQQVLDDYQRVRVAGGSRVDRGRGSG